MHIPMKANVYCDDGYCGRSTRIIITPLALAMTRLVVEEIGNRSIERLIPSSYVTNAAPDAIRLGCTRDDVANTMPLAEIAWTRPGSYLWAPLFHDYLTQRALIGPHVSLAKRTNILPDEIAVRHGTRVETTSGYVGQFERALVDPREWQLTHLILRNSRRWGNTTTTVSIRQVRRVGGVLVPPPTQSHNVGVCDAFAFPSKD
jgi:hypothetical protein